MQLPKKIALMVFDACIYDFILVLLFRIVLYTPLGLPVGSMNMVFSKV